MLIVLGIGFFCCAVYVLLTGLTVRQREVALSVRRAKRYGTRNQRELETRRSVNDRLLGPMAARLASVTMRLMPKTNPDQVANKLLSAGLARSLSPQAYLALKAGLGGVFILFGLFVTVTGAMAPAFGFLIAMMGAAIGFIAPDFVINNRIRGRKDRMRAELPNVLDLLCVSVEAGLGFDQALVKLNERMEGPLVDEFGLVLHEMRIGQSRSAALKNLSKRVEAAEVAQFARAIVQADQLGISLSRILRVQSQDMRLRRQLAAEEKAMKAPVKMLFPTVIFIFPSMFVVALGPAALNLMKSFSGG
ncbi:MAG: tight adherence protein [Gaiellales bacterium]|jgi:tight adherence protein C|nr:tight adherence protein [Gaiellales bacterium]